MDAEGDNARKKAAAGVGKPETVNNAENPVLATQKARIVMASAQLNKDGSKKFPTMLDVIAEATPDALIGLTGNMLIKQLRALRITVNATKREYIRDLEILKNESPFSLKVANSETIFNEIKMLNPGAYEGEDGINKLIKLLETPFAGGPKLKPVKPQPAKAAPRPFLPHGKPKPVDKKVIEQEPEVVITKITRLPPSGDGQPTKRPDRPVARTNTHLPPDRLVYGKGFMGRRGSKTI
jgi:hypothetical protein